jgi:hypothetical protein
MTSLLAYANNDVNKKVIKKRGRVFVDNKGGAAYKI